MSATLKKSNRLSEGGCENGGGSDRSNCQGGSTQRSNVDSVNVNVVGVSFSTVLANPSLVGCVDEIVIVVLVVPGELCISCIVPFVTKGFTNSIFGWIINDGYGFEIWLFGDTVISWNFDIAVPGLECLAWTSKDTPAIVFTFDISANYNIVIICWCVDVVDVDSKNEAVGVSAVNEILEVFIARIVPESQVHRRDIVEIIEFTEIIWLSDFNPVLGGIWCWSLS